MSPRQAAETLIFMALAEIVLGDIDEDGPIAKLRDELEGRANAVADAVDVPANDGEQAVVDMARLALQFVDAPAITREKAIEIAIKHAAQNKENRGYLDLVLCTRDWQPHGWVVDAIMEAAAPTLAAIDGKGT